MSTSHGTTAPRVFTVPPGEPFLDRLAAAVLSSELVPPLPISEPFGLARTTILLPTRRSSRVLTDCFLALGGGATLLPRIRPLGDIDEDEFVLASGNNVEELHLPPAVSTLERDLTLARILLEWSARNPDHLLGHTLTTGPAQSIKLAKSLGQLLAAFETEGLTLDMLGALRDGDYPEHRAAMVDFLSVVQDLLPHEFAQRGVIGALARRNLLLEAEASRLALTLPNVPMIAAGSTGSIPATARLLSAISRLPRGAVILPGLDQDLDDHSWDQLPPQHPQYGLKMLLEKIGIDRQDVRVLPGCRPSRRGRFLSEVMRPAETTELWQAAISSFTSRDLEAATNGLELIPAATHREEALCIAMIMRQVLEEPARQAALITPDRRLARRVASELARWNIFVDDSAGVPLSQTSAGSFAFLLLDASLNKFAPVQMLALLKHPLAAFGFERADLRRRARSFEMVALRGLRPPPGLQGLQNALQNARKGQHRRNGRISEQTWIELDELMIALAERLQPFQAVMDGTDRTSLQTLTEAHLKAAEACAPSDPQGCYLWRGEEGEGLAALFATLIEASSHGPKIEPFLYPSLLREVMAGQVVRPNANQHPRLSIYGLLEARLITSDVIILGGLNEGVWPPESQEDPWLSRPMRAAMGLLSPERRQGLAAHDFVQAMAGQKVYGTWSAKIDGAPATASRWILRLKALLDASRAGHLIASTSPWVAWARMIDDSSTPAVLAIPKPRPATSLRPRRLSVTEIETWIRDPYAIFAKHILKLRRLDELDRIPGPAERGVLVHAALQRFSESYPEALPQDIERTLLACGEAEFADWLEYTDVRSFWWPQFQRMASWFAVVERGLREGVSRSLVELGGRIEVPGPMGPFELTARADRFDIFADGSVRILDYKTGRLPTHKQEQANFSPQLLLEVKMAEHGGFELVGPVDVKEFAYVRLSGGNPPGEIRTAPADDAITDMTMQGLSDLVAAYDDENQPYIPRVRIERQDAELDYDHLSRFREWSSISAVTGTEVVDE
ncbi:ATP-dependent helicase/nuclease subunit B [Rhodoligotrophos appendicifer]|uniref:double-strand break repair protein AddB n=1 Tax=Rhodoligotrophos appendicifer TaxID=987056 RepID=UPI00117ED30C|nr:double-strand break repair protein AddB [Rhodoligotrophos appendicifer]